MNSQVEAFFAPCREGRRLWATLCREEKENSSIFIIKAIFKMQVTSVRPAFCIAQRCGGAPHVAMHKAHFGHLQAVRTSRNLAVLMKATPEEELDAEVREDKIAALFESRFNVIAVPLTFFK